MKKEKKINDSKITLILKQLLKDRMPKVVSFQRQFCLLLSVSKDWMCVPFGDECHSNTKTRSILLNLPGFLSLLWCTQWL